MRVRHRARHESRVPGDTDSGYGIELVVRLSREPNQSVILSAIPDTSMITPSLAAAEAHMLAGQALCSSINENTTWASNR